jgi:hypothetical protein
MAWCEEVDDVLAFLVVSLQVIPFSRLRRCGWVDGLGGLMDMVWNHGVRMN